MAAEHNIALVKSMDRSGIDALRSRAIFKPEKQHRTLFNVRTFLRFAGSEHTGTFLEFIQIRKQFGIHPCRPQPLTSLVSISQHRTKHPLKTTKKPSLTSTTKFSPFPNSTKHPKTQAYHNHIPLFPMTKSFLPIFCRPSLLDTLRTNE